MSLVAGFMLILVGSTQASPSVDEVVSNYRQTVTHFKSYSALFEKTEQTSLTIPPGENATRHARSRGRLISDGEKFDFRYTILSQTPDRPTEPERKTGVQQIWDGQRNYNYKFHATEDQPDPDLLPSRFVPPQSSQWDKVFLSEDSAYKDQICSSAPDYALRGYFRGSTTPLLSRLEQAAVGSVNVAEEAVNGNPCVSLSFHCQEGTHKVWFDTNHGYNVAKAEIVSSGQDQFIENPVEKLYGEGATVTLTLDVDKFSQLSNAWLPRHASWTLSIKDKSGKEIRHEQSECSYTTYDVEPDFASMGAFIPNIAEGTTAEWVESGKKNPIPYHWTGETAQPKVYQNTEEAIKTAIEGVSDSKPEATVARTASVEPPEARAAAVSSPLGNNTRKILMIASGAGALVVVLVLLFTVSRRRARTG